jgi:hypothetical protein
MIVMTTLHKILIGVTFAIFAGFGIYEARQTASLRNQFQTLQQLQAPVAEQVRLLQSERDAASNRLAVLRDQSKRFDRDTAELLALRDQVANLKADSQELSLLKEHSWNTRNDPTALTRDAWLPRAKALQRRVEKMPDASIPEFQFLRDVDWLDVARHSSYARLEKDDGTFIDLKPESDESMAGAVVQLRVWAKHEFALQMSAALKKFIDAEGGRLPAQLAELKPFFSVPVGDDVLERYEMMRSGNVNDLPKHDREWRLVSEKKSAADSSDQSMIQIGAESYGRLSSY